MERLTALGLRKEVSSLRQLDIQAGGWIDLRHGHREALDRDVVIEGLENIPGHQRVVHASIFVFFEAMQPLRANVDHDG